MVSILHEFRSSSWSCEGQSSFPFCSQLGRMVPGGCCQRRSCRWTEQSSSSMVSAAASVLWLRSSDSGRVSAVLFASLPLACSRSLSLPVSYALTHVLFSLAAPSFLTPAYFSIFLSCLPLLFSPSFCLYFSLCISSLLTFLFLCAPVCSTRTDPPLPLDLPPAPLPHTELKRQLETSSARTGLSSSHKHCSQDQREAQRQAGLNAEQRWG